MVNEQWLAFSYLMASSIKPVAETADRQIQHFEYSSVSCRKVEACRRMIQCTMHVLAVAIGTTSLNHHKLIDVLSCF